MKKKKKSLLALSLFTFLVSSIAHAQVNDTYVIPAAADTAGANGTRWATELHLFNPQAYPLRITMVFLPTGGSQGRTVEFTVGANSTAFAENVLDDVFDTSGTGALLIATFPEKNPTVPNNVLDRAFLVNSKTFNNASSGTFGQPIPGTWVGLFDFVSDPISAVASGVRNTSSGPSGYRANIGAVNLGRRSATLKVSVYDSAGKTLLERVPFILPPQGHIQDRLPVNVDHGSVEFFVDDPSNEAVVFPYVSVIDNRSGDPTYIQPVLLASAGSLYKMAPAASQNPGRKINSEIARNAMSNSLFVGEAMVGAAGRLSVTR